MFTPLYKLLEYYPTLFRNLKPGAIPTLQLPNSEASELNINSARQQGFYTKVRKTLLHRVKYLGPTNNHQMKSIKACREILYMLLQIFRSLITVNKLRKYVKLGKEKWTNLRGYKN